jgi:hypothetical protein
MNRRLDDLFTYLNLLDNLNRAEYSCHREITECISEIRKELALGE